MTALASAVASTSSIAAAGASEIQRTAFAPEAFSQSLGRRSDYGSSVDIIVVGAGVFGAWAAARLQAAGKQVVLVDAWGPGHARASSGGESRMIRASYGPDEIYSRMATKSLEYWKSLSATADLPLFHETGVLYFYQWEDQSAAQSLTALRRLGVPVERLERKVLAQRWPQIDWTGVVAGVFEPTFGALMARRSVATLVDQFVRAGGAYRQASILLPAADGPLETLQTRAGETLKAEQFVFACGPWLGKLFPSLIAERLFVTRQEILFFQPPAGDDRFGPNALPGWADDNDGAMYYGFPDIEGRGFKIALDAHGAPVDPDTEDRLLSPEGLAGARAYMARRFPALADARLSESRVCQYENSANGDFLIDRHPDWENAILVGMGSGHGFKHGPAVGDLVASLVAGGAPEPRFTLASKSTEKARAVH